MLKTNSKINDNNRFIKDLLDKPFTENTLQMLIKEYHYQTVKNIIEENTDKYSIFHYAETRLINKINGISYWMVKQIGSNKSSILNSNKEFVIPFDYYNYIETTKDDKYILCTQNNNKLIYDYSGNLIEGHLSDYVPIDIQEKNEKCTYASSLIEEVKDLHIISEHIFRLKKRISFMEENLKVVKQNTQLMEKTQTKHSVFDCCKSQFFTNGNNKRYFALQEISSQKSGLINAKGKLIAPFIYDGLGPFVYGEGDFIHMEIENKYGLLDCLGNIVLNPISENVISFNEGLAVLEINKKFGYMDITGNIVIPIIYDYALPFLYGKAKVELNDESYYINRKGERVEEC